MKRVFISDCEGPISKNDNAFEVASHFLPNGDQLYRTVSNYDDVLADVVRRPNYTAGFTLSFILPFLKTYGVTDQKLSEFSAMNLTLIPGVRHTLEYVRRIGYAFVVSTSYEHYIRALCEAIGFPYSNTYCTKIRMDSHSLTTEDETALKELMKEIQRLPKIVIPQKARSLEDLPKESKATIERLDRIFWKEIAGMRSGGFFTEVSPVGGIEKAHAVQDAARRVDVDLSNIIYVGDSITDVEAFRLIRENDGLTVSFNGNEYAIRNAEIAILSQDSASVEIVADVFCRSGKPEAIEMIENWSRRGLEKSSANRLLVDRLNSLHPHGLPTVKLIDNRNIRSLEAESSKFRRLVRGDVVGGLG